MSVETASFSGEICPGHVLAGRYDVWLCDVWGVLHNGFRCYASANEAMRMLHAHGKEIVILSNSGNSVLDS